LIEVDRLAHVLEYETINAEANESKSLSELLAPELRRVLLSLDRMGQTSETVKRGLRVLASFVSRVKLTYGDMEFGLDISPEKGVADSGDLESDLAQLITALGEAAQSRNKAAAIILDEIQHLGDEELSALIMAMHRVSQRKLPVILVGAGLPQLVGQMGDSKSYAERLFNFPNIGQLSKQDATKALQGPARDEDAEFAVSAVNEIIRVTEGYPYFLQEWGHHAWDLAQKSPITLRDVKAATANAIRSLDQSFFRVRFDRLTPREKDYLRAMAELGPGPHRSGDIAECLGVKVESVAPLRSGLIRKGMVYSPQHGDTAFTVPLFDQYMKRVMPSMPKKRK
jgi:hypothetical protein